MFELVCAYVGVCTRVYVCVERVSVAHMCVCVCVLGCVCVCVCLCTRVSVRTRVFVLCVRVWQSRIPTILYWSGVDNARSAEGAKTRVLIPHRYVNSFGDVALTVCIKQSLQVITCHQQFPTLGI